MKMPPELHFLNGFYDDPKITYRTSDWLLSDFDAMEWEYSFGFASPKSIDWGVTLEDGQALTSSKHRNLLKGLKYFLILSTRHQFGSKPESNSIKSQGIAFAKAVHLIDYLLLHSSDFQLATYGLTGLSGNDLKHILTAICENKDSSESVYAWSKTIAKHCRELLNSTDPCAIDGVLDAVPEINIVTPEQEDEYALDIPIALIPRARAALYLGGLYNRVRNIGYIPNSVKISNILYRNTIKGRTDDKPTISALTYKFANDDFVREHSGVPVTTGQRSTMTQSSFNQYRSVLYNLGTLHDLDVPAPAITDLMQMLEFQMDLSSQGRFRTLPSSVVLSAVKHAVEFHLKHGEKLVNGFCRLAAYCKQRKIRLSSLSDADVTRVVGKQLQEFGVCQLGLSCRNTGTALHADSIKGDKSGYYEKLRSNAPMLELMGVYIGGVQLVVGALMARRVGELQDLHSTTCLDISEQWLIFKNRKSTRRIFGLRKTEARPIEPVAVSMIKNLIRMQKILKRVGYIDEITYLFASPSTRGDVGFAKPNMYIYNRNLDIFCDYFETQLNSKGARYYIRQHQLRRFFAMLFFHSSSFGGLETLQWMLGHTDARHVWHYITETMDGAVLRGAKSQYVAEQLHREGTQGYDDLAALLKERYGTEDFALVDTNELEDEISDLMKAGEVEIEPEFFEDENGQHIRVIAKIKGAA